MKTTKILKGFYDYFEDDDLFVFITFSLFVFVFTAILDGILNFVGPGYDFSNNVYIIGPLGTVLFPIIFPIIMLPFIALEVIYIATKKYVFKLEEN